MWRSLAEVVLVTIATEFVLRFENADNCDYKWIEFLLLSYILASGTAHISRASVLLYY